MTQPSPPSSDDAVFISYARADDLQPPFQNRTQGWVTFFWHLLRYTLVDSGAKQAELWLDRYQIEPAEAFTPRIETALAQAKLIIAIFSKNWVQSEWCRREAEMFGRIHSDACERIVPVFKNEINADELPYFIRGEQARVGYRFFTSDITGKMHDFYWCGLKDEGAYFDLIKQIAHFISDRLKITQSQSTSPQITPSGRTVFIAAAASDLRDARQRLVNDLCSAGFQVVPAIDPLPDTNEKLEDLIKQALSNAELAIHLLGDGRGITVEGGTEPIVDQQLRLARDTSLPRILWAPRWLPAHAGNLRDPFEVIKNFGGLCGQEEIHGGEMTDLSQWIRQRLKPATDTLNIHPSKKFKQILIAAAHTDDEELAIALANQIQGYGLPVQPYFPGQDLPSAFDHLLVLVPWGAANGAELQSLLSRLKQPAQTICLCLPGGDETAKRRFFQENVLLEKIAALPNNRQATRKLLALLDILPPTEYES